MNGTVSPTRGGVAPLEPPNNVLNGQNRNFQIFQNFQKIAIFDFFSTWKFFEIFWIFFEIFSEFSENSEKFRCPGPIWVHSGRFRTISGESIPILADFKKSGGPSLPPAQFFLFN